MRAKSRSDEGASVNVMHPLEQLRSQLRGRVEPGDPDYDQARTVFYGGEERHPAAIARVASAEDVARVVTFTREMGLELAVRSGGHSVARHSVVDRGIVLDLGAMKGLEIDADDR
jgi:FAD/FMN-containing dehydrogenase